MAALLRAVLAEARKTVTTRMWWVLALVLFGYIALSAGAIALAFGSISTGSGAEPGLDEVRAQLPVLVYSTATAVGYVFPVIFGAMMVTSEARHRTLTVAFLAFPGRAVVLVAKGIVGAVVGAAYGVIAVAASVGVGASILAAMGLDANLGDGETWLLLARIVLAMAVWGLVGVGVGAMVPSQIGSIVGILAFTQLVEPLLRTAAAFVDWVAEVGRFLPGAAGDALVGASIYVAFGTSGGSTSLEWWQGGLVLLAYAAVFGAVGALTTWRRDVT